MSEETLVRVGVIGVGGAGEWHLGAFNRMAGVQVVAVCDVDAQRAQEVAARHQVSHVFTEPSAFLALAEMDAVMIGTAHDSHAPIAATALRAGKHVLTQKPMALNVEQAREVVEAERASGKHFMIYYGNRFGPAHRLLKQFVDEGELGDIYHVKAGALSRWNVLQRRYGQKAISGGPLVDHGSHMVDLALWFLDFPEPVSALGCLYRKFGDEKARWGLAGGPVGPNDAGSYDVEDYASGLVRFENGAGLFLEVSAVAHVERSHLAYVTLLGTKAGAELRWGTEMSPSPQLYLYSARHGSLVNLAPVLPPPPASPFDPAHPDLAMQHFIECVRRDQPPSCSAEEGLLTTRMLEAIERSATTGHEAKP